MRINLKKKSLLFVSFILGFCPTSQSWFWHSLATLNLLFDINLPLHHLSSDNDEMCMLFASIQLWKGGNTACLTEVGGSTKSTVELGQVPLYRTNETTPVQLLLLHTSMLHSPSVSTILL